jgi:hypothetical protein
MDARVAKHMCRTYTRDEAQDLVEMASCCLEYGPDYDRGIASAAQDVVDCLARGRDASHFAGILALRLEGRPGRFDP